MGVNIVAQAQVQPPATDVYINTDKSTLKILSQSTILHEALHNLTGLDDYQLEEFLGLNVTKIVPSSVINDRLKEKECAN
jgi:hypothetical protein